MEYLYKTIYNNILNDIIMGKLLPGDKIPTELELTKKYNVSRITATKAINELVSAGYLYRKRKKGTFVKSQFLSTDSTIKEKNKIITFITPVDEYLCFQLIIGTQDAATKEGYCIAHYNSCNNIEKEAEYINNAFSLDVSGIIVFPAAQNQNYNNINKYFEIQQRGIPLVFVDNKPNIVTAPLINSNNFEASYFLTSKLIEKGHRKIAFFLTNEIMLPSVESRLAGYAKALIDNKIPFNFKYVYKEKIFEETKYQNELTNLEFNICDAIDTFFGLDNPPTAVICINDEVASKFIHFARIKKLDIPKKMSVASFDNSSFAIKSEVPISTMAQNFAEIGIEATNTVINILNNKKAISKSIKMKYIERESIATI